MEIEKVKGWLGVVFIVWPIAKALLKGFGVELPDIGLPMDQIGIASQAAGTVLLANAEPIKKK